MPGVRSNDARRSRFGPFGFLGRTPPDHFRAILNALWQNRKEIPYAWSILNHGVCDGCSLGADGLRDDVVGGLHLCTMRLMLLQQNTMGAIDLAALADVSRLQGLESQRLRSLGRLAYPMVRRKGQRGFLRITWDESLSIIAKAIRQITPHELGFLITSHGLTDEIYYVFQKLARVLGTNNIDLCPGLCPAASIAGLRASLGYGASTCSLSDFIGTDLLVVFGSDLASKATTSKYLHYARKAGTRILVVDSISADSGERSWTELSSATARSNNNADDDYFRLRHGGDTAFINGVLKFLVLAERVDRPFIERHTAGFPALASALEAQSWDMLEQRSGMVRERMQRFAETYSQARTAVFVYGIEFTRNESAGDNVNAVVNLALARAMLGREKCGIMPICGYSSAQGAADCGVEPNRFSGGFTVNDDTARRFSNLWHHPVPSLLGLAAPAMVGAAHEGRIKFLYSIGADLFETAPDPSFVESALSQVPLRVHQDIALNASMLLDPSETVVLLPGQTRYEQRTGGISTSTERRIRFTPEISGHQIGETLPNWEIPILVGQKSMSNGNKLFPFNDTQAIREEMSRIMPIYQGVDQLTKEGDQLQWGGAQLYKDGFSNMPMGRALFTLVDPLDPQVAANKKLASRRIDHLDRRPRKDTK
jgi:molybdopterin-dependent oxidoreductase alpha subunit